MFSNYTNIRAHDSMSDLVNGDLLELTINPYGRGSKGDFKT